MAVGPFDLNLRHLRALVAVREHGSVLAAADAVSLSQPALTQGIAKLERQLDCALFERRSDGMVTTEVGAMVQERVAAAMQHLAAGLRLPSQGAVDAQLEHRITMTQLRAYLALVRAGGFGEAGRATGLSQTAVHRAVRDLETAIRRPLVERRGRGVVLNAAGQCFARGTRLAVAEITAIVSELGLDDGGSTIACGTLPLARPFLVPEVMAKMVAEDAAAGFRIFEGSWAELVEQLREGVIDVVVGELPPHELSDLTQTPLRHDPLVIVGGVQHPLAGPRSHSLETLSAFPWIVGPPGSPLRVEWERLFAGRRLPSGPIECGSVMIIGRLLTSANFLAVLAPDQVALQIRSGLLARVGPPIPGRSFQMGIMTRKSWRPTGVQRRFIELLREVAEGGGTSRPRVGAMVGEWV
jgi:DNA-binding transcriptional LysR family regulator